MRRCSSPPPRIRTRLRPSALAPVAAVAAAALAGCGGAGDRTARPQPPRLARADGRQLILLADVVARDAARDPCAARGEIERLRTRAIALVNAHRVPAALQDPLLSGVNALAALKPACAPPTPAPVSRAGDDGEDHGDHGHGHGHGEGHGKKGRH